MQTSEKLRERAIKNVLNCCLNNSCSMYVIHMIYHLSDSRDLLQIIIYLND